MSNRTSPNDALLRAFLMNLAGKRAHLEDLSARLEAFRPRPSKREEAEAFWKMFSSVDYNINRIDPNDPSNAPERIENTEYGE